MEFKGLGEGRRREVGAWEMKPEAKPPGPAGLGRSLRQLGREWAGGAPRPSRQPHPASGEEEAPGRLQAAAASGYPAGGQPREEGGQGVGTWTPWARPEVSAAHTPPRDGGEGRLGNVDFALRDPVPSARPAFTSLSGSLTGQELGL